MVGKPNFGSTPLVVSLVDALGYKVDDDSPLPVKLSASVELTGDFEIGGVYLMGDASGNKVEVTSGNSLKVDGSSVTQPISVASLPLPSGAATGTKQDTQQTSLTAINSDTTALNTKQTTGNASLASIDTKLTTLNTTLNSPFQAGGSIGNASFGVSGTLPAFASTPTFNIGTIGTAASAANQATEISGLAAILSALGTPAQSGGSVSVSNLPATQPISAANLPLPSGAAVEAGGNLAAIAQNSKALNTALNLTDDSIAASLTSIVNLLQVVEFRLRELPLNIAVALNQTLNVNKGAIQYNSSIDSLDVFQFSSANHLNN